jgi:tetratricopeptide (TPR) repeat protein
MKRTLLVCGALLLAACSRSEPSSQTLCPALDAGSPVDPILLAFLSRARSAHHLADNLESSGDLPASAAPLERLVEGPVPGLGSSTELAPEVREVLADTYARLADLHSRQGEFDRALKDVQLGLSHAREPNYFQGHLLETEGLVEERHAKALETTDKIAATAIRKRAIELLERAMAVQSGVIEHAPPAGAAAASARTPTPAASSR